MLFGLVVTGKALALGVLMLSLSDRMSFLMGVSYLQSDSFVCCAVVAIALLLLSRFFSSSKNRLALSIFVMIGALTWSAFLLGVSLGYLASYWFVFVCGS